MISTAKLDINTFVNKELPPLPGSAMRVISVLQDDNNSTRTVADAIGLDPMLTAKILQAANSPLYALESNVTSLPKAVTTMGNQTIYYMILAFTAQNAFAQEIKNSVVGQTIWEHSLAVGAAAREIGLALGLRGTEELFTCGLLHDIGKLLFLRYDINLYAELKDNPFEADALAFEKQKFGFTHAQVGGLAVRRWGIPNEISYAIANHHNPSEAEQFMLTARIIDVADEIANAAGLGVRNPKEMSELLWTESVIALKLSLEQIEKVWFKMMTSMQEMTQAFN